MQTLCGSSSKNGSRLNAATLLNVFGNIEIAWVHQAPAGTRRSYVSVKIRVVSIQVKRSRFNTCSHSDDGHRLKRVQSENIIFANPAGNDLINVREVIMTLQQMRAVERRSMISSESSEAQLTSLKNDFDRLYSILMSAEAKQALAEAEHGPHGAARTANKLRDMMVAHSLSNFLPTASPGFKFCIDLIIISFDSEKGWQWGSCDK
jgi:hypothetical protein